MLLLPPKTCCVCLRVGSLCSWVNVLLLPRLHPLHCSLTSWDLVLLGGLHIVEFDMASTRDDLPAAHVTDTAQQNADQQMLNWRHWRNKSGRKSIPFTLKTNTAFVIQDQTIAVFEQWVVFASSWTLTWLVWVYVFTLLGRESHLKMSPSAPCGQDPANK